MHSKGHENVKLRPIKSLSMLYLKLPQPNFKSSFMKWEETTNKSYIRALNDPTSFLECQFNAICTSWPVHDFNTVLSEFMQSSKEDCLVGFFGPERTHKKTLWLRSVGLYFKKMRAQVE